MAVDVEVAVGCSNFKLGYKTSLCNLKQKRQKLGHFKNITIMREGSTLLKATSAAIMAVFPVTDSSPLDPKRLKLTSLPALPPSSLLYKKMNYLISTLTSRKKI